MRKISIVVPAHNEEVLLPTCLKTLLAQDYPGPIEIFVVNNGSTDATAEVARRFGVTVLEEPTPGYRQALASGFAAATGDIVASTDADTRVPRDWISRFVREYEADPDVVAVGGAIVFCDPNWRASLLTRWLLPVINRVDRRNGRGPHLWGANFSVRRDAFLAAAGWNPGFELQADTELSERMRDQGRVVLLEDVKVWSSSRRWNRALLSSMYLYASNFAWFKATGRPLYQEFPVVRDRAPAAWEWLRPRPALLVVVFLLLAGAGGYLATAPESNAFGQTYWRAQTSQKQIALTFDDGPNEPYTSEVLDILAREHVRATFFMVGVNVRRYPQAAARAAHDGHVIGNHSNSHPDALAFEPSSRMQVEVATAEATIHAATGLYPRFFRPPHGLRSPWLIATLTSDSLVVVTWDDAPGDWNPIPARRLVQLTLAHAHPGSIILLHDGMNLAHGIDRSETIKALPEIVRGLRRRGYQFVTVPELLHQAPYLPRWIAEGAPRPTSRTIHQRSAA